MSVSTLPSLHPLSTCLRIAFSADYSGYHSDLKMTTQRVKLRPSERIWERHKATIRKLYLEEDKTLDEVMRAMISDHGFISKYGPSLQSIMSTETLQ